MGVAIMGAVSVLLVRWFARDHLPWVWWSLGGFVFIGAILSWCMARGRFENQAAARVRLEDALGLKTRLSAATDGVGAWPEIPSSIQWPVSWRWQRPALVAAFAAIMMMAALFIPMSEREGEQPRVIEKPSAVQDVEEWMADLRKEEAVEEESLKEIEDKVAELLKRPAENWYEHGSLEAAGNLKEQTAEMLRELSQNLADAERSASALQAAGSGLPQAAKDALAQQLKEAGQNLASAGMKPNEQLLKQLQQMGAQGLQNLSQEQLKELAEQMKQNADALQKALQNSPEIELTQCQGSGEKEGEGPGRGGINRGPGEAPLSLAREEANLNTEKMEQVTSDLDFKRLAPGDLMGTSDGKHEVDETAKGPQQGGVIQHAADGGAAVWQHSLLPEERETLRRYFK